VSYETLTRWRYRLWPDHVVGEILSKPWMETAIPVLVLVLTFLGMSAYVPTLASGSHLAIIAREGGETGFVVLGLALVMLAGGVDLSVGSIFALSNFVALLLMHEFGWAAPPAIAVTVLAGMGLGAVNGVLIGYMRLFPAILKIPYHYLYPAIVVLGFIGVFTGSATAFNFVLLLGFAFLGLAMEKLRMPISPFILAFILGPMLELNLRKGMTYTDEGIWPFFTRPISGLLLAAAVFSILSPYALPPIKAWVRARRGAT